MHDLITSFKSNFFPSIILVNNHWRSNSRLRKTRYIVQIIEIMARYSRSSSCYQSTARMWFPISGNSYVGHIFYRFWDIATKTSGNRRPFYPTQIHWKDWSFADIFANFGLKKLESLDHCHSTVKTACSYVQSSRHWYRKLPLQNCWFHPFNAQSSGEFMHGPYVAVTQGCLSAAASLDLSWFILYDEHQKSDTR